MVEKSKYKSEYKTKYEWKKAHPKEYIKAQRYGDLEYICEMYGWDFTNSKNYYWSKDKCRIEALKFTNRTQWYKGSQSSYQTARRNGWLDELTTHMESDINRKPYGYWAIKENVLKEARKHKTTTDWQKKSGGASGASIKHGWYDECIAHMDGVKDMITKEICLKLAKMCKNKTEFRELHGSAYSKSLHNNWYSEICKVMKWKYTKQTKWDIDILLETIGDSTSTREWVKHYGSYRPKKMSQKLGLWKECQKKMKENEIKRAEKMIEERNSIQSKINDENPFITDKIIDMGLSVRTRHCLRSANIHTLGDLVSFRKKELMNIRNFGVKCFREVNELVELKGLTWVKLTRIKKIKK